MDIYLAKIQFMIINQIGTGKFVDGREIVSVELKNSKGTSVNIFNYGTIINRFEIINAKGDKQDIVLGFDKIEGYFDQDYLDNGAYLGAVIGRYANRIKDGAFNLNGKSIQVTKNSDGNLLHGGNEGFDKKIWDITEIGDEERAFVTFEYESEGDEEGFPGNLLVSLTFELTENNELILSYEAQTDGPTVINLTHHDYFNLAINGGSIANHVQQIFASNYLEQDISFAATGNLLDVQNSKHDFLKPRAIGDDWDSEEGYDQSFVLDKQYGDLTLASNTFEKESGLTLSVYTTEPVAHFYTAKYLNVEDGKMGRSYNSFEAFCIETQHHPNAVNVPQFPSTNLNPGELYTQTTIFKVSSSV